MMEASEIEKRMGPAIAARDCFAVSTEISPDNDITLTVEKDKGSVDMDDCVAISRAFESAFDRSVEDYSLTVSSAGLDKPFKVLRQYSKAIGTMVVAKLKGGKKIIGELTAADNDEITLKYKVKETVEGQKKKQVVEYDDSFPMSEVNSVAPFLKSE